MLEQLPDPEGLLSIRRVMQLKIKNGFCKNCNKEIEMKLP